MQQGPIVRRSDDLPDCLRRREPLLTSQMSTVPKIRYGDHCVARVKAWGASAVIGRRRGSGRQTKAWTGGADASFMQAIVGSGISTYVIQPSRHGSQLTLK